MTTPDAPPTRRRHSRRCRPWLHRCGITRNVLLVGQYAVKIPSFRPGLTDGVRGRMWSFARGWLANESEYVWWTQGTPQMRMYLCPVLHSWFFGLVQIYPRAELAPVDADGEYTGAWGPKPPLDPFPGDDKADNLGRIYGGRLVFLDYDMSYNGCPHDRSGAINRAAEPREA